MIDNLAFLLANIGVVMSVYLMLRSEKKDKEQKLKQDKKNRRA